MRKIEGVNLYLDKLYLYNKYKNLQNARLVYIIWYSLLLFIVLFILIK